jgi:hypothetical protein
MTEKLSYEEFVKQAILKPRTGDYKRIHTVYSGFTEAVRAYFGGANPIEITTQLAREKKIVIRPVKGGRAKKQILLPKTTAGLREFAIDVFRVILGYRLIRLVHQRG